MRNGYSRHSTEIEGYVNKVIASGDRRLIEPLRNVAEIIRSAARSGAVSNRQNQDLQKEFSRMSGNRSYLPEEFALLASGIASDTRLRNTVVKLTMLADDILVRTKHLPLPLASSARLIACHAEETPIPS
ncbi:MAG TPA: hypothetical protein VN397_05165 [Candidatus Methylomirabilis sp.]|nr:hypothetical protein [Candidatus Methylomirabilis sp.]